MYHPGVPSDPPSDAGPAAPTRKKPKGGGSAARSRVPCLTLCCHADLSRIGERVLLRGLLVRSPVALSRSELSFAHPGSERARTLEDPYLSRAKVILSGDPERGVRVSYERSDLRVDGARVEGSAELDREQLDAGVVLELAERVVLLLHMVEGASYAASEELDGHSDVIEAVRRDVARIGPLDVPVLVRGESGSGKERAALALHRLSARRERPLVSVNMAAVATQTAASVLFGHARGAFTGAIARHAGLFEQADGGTLFLDEIGETPQDVQPMLLRVLETGRFTPLGDARERKVDVRVVAATDADLDDDVAAGQFREALLHRISGYEIRVPPLRERRDDIPRLLRAFLAEELARLGRAERMSTQASDDTPLLATSVITTLLAHPLPGNVRQLRNVVRRLALSGLDAPQLAIDEPTERLLELGGTRRSVASVAGPAPESAGVRRRGTAITDLELLAALEANGYSPRRTAAALAIPISTLHDLMRRCPSLRKAKDIDDAELREALASSGGKIEQTAALLRVSERGLRITLRERGLADT